MNRGVLSYITLRLFTIMNYPYRRMSVRLVPSWQTCFVKFEIWIFCKNKMVRRRYSKVFVPHLLLSPQHMSTVTDLRYGR